MATFSNREPKEGSPSFFKVIRNPSAPQLPLPNAFVRRYFEKIPKNPTLVTATGEHSWRLEFAKIGEDYCFVNGWEKLVKDVQLCIKDIVIFWLIDPLTFQVSFLGVNGCEKDLPFIKPNDVDDVKVDCQDGDIVGECHYDHHDDDVIPEEILGFRKVFSKKTYRYCLSLPINFVKAAGLEHKQSIKLKDHDGKEWIMGIIAERYERTKYSISVGWSMFHKYHRLSDGDVCMFIFDKKEGVLNLTQVLKSKTPSEQESPMKEVNRNRGTPSCYGGGNVKIEDDWSPTEKPCNGGAGGGGRGVKVKIEDESGPEMEVVKRKKERRRLENSLVKVKIEDGSDPVMVVGKTKSGMPPPEGPSSRGGGHVEVETEPVTPRVFRSKHVIYF